MNKKDNIKPTNMYKDAKTWNPFKGCKYDCTYCKPSYQLQAKRQKHNCSKCYEFTPHQHPERLSKIPNAKIVFVAGNGDLSFCDSAFVKQIIAAIVKKNLKRPEQVYYLQTKRPEFLAQFIGEFPSNAILVTTLETNRDEGYGAISKALPPSRRYAQFKQLKWHRKVVTIEPIMDFDLDVFAEWLISLNPECVWIGFNTRPHSVSLPEPSDEKVLALAERLRESGIRMRGKELRGIELYPKPLVNPKTEDALREACLYTWAFYGCFDDLLQNLQGIPTEIVARENKTVGNLIEELHEVAEAATDNVFYLLKALKVEEADNEQ